MKRIAGLAALFAAALLTAPAYADVVLETKLSGTGDNVVFDSVSINSALGHLNGPHLDVVRFTDLGLSSTFTGAANGNDIKIANTNNLRIQVFDPTNTNVVGTTTQVFSLKGTGDVHISVVATDGTFNFDLGVIDPNAQSGFTLSAINGEVMTMLTLLDVGGTIADFEHYRIDVATPAAVPLPGALWLFGAGLLGMIGLGRKQKMLTGRTSFVTAALLAATMLFVPGAANADEIKFFSGTDESPLTANAFTIASGTVYQAIRNLNTACPGGGPGNCSGNADVRATSVNFAGGISASNTGPAGTGVIADLQPDFAGLGVGPLTGIPSDQDQISVGDSLTIHFPTDVVLRGVSTLFDGAHTPFGPGFDINTNVIGANMFAINGNPVSFLAANLATLALIGHDFTFTALLGQPQYYISGLEFSAVPLPGAVWLFGSALFGLGLLRRKAA